VNPARNIFKALGCFSLTIFSCCAASSARKATKGPRKLVYDLRRLVPPVEEPTIKEGDFPPFKTPKKIKVSSNIDDVTDVKRTVRMKYYLFTLFII